MIYINKLEIYYVSNAENVSYKTMTSVSKSDKLEPAVHIAEHFSFFFCHYPTYTKVYHYLSACCLQMTYLFHAGDTF